MKRKRHIHYGRVLMCAFVLGSLIYGISRIVGLLLETPDTVPATETIMIQSESISITNTVIRKQEEPSAAEETMDYVSVPESMQLDVPYISQEGILPTGCELISAKMVLEYYGAEATVDEIVENTFSAYPVTRSGKTYAYSPYTAFIGSPLDETSFGCYPPVIVDMMNKLLPDDKTAVDISGTELSEIAETYIPRGTPVLVWATINMMETYPNVGWYLLDENGGETDEWYDWKANEHCLVLVGYDSDNYYFNDPYRDNGLVCYSRELAETRYEEIGMCAVIVTEC